METKKLLAGVALAAVICAATGASARVNPGVYAGVQAGLSHLNTKGKYRSLQVASTTPTATIGKKTAFQAGILLGYETMVSDNLIAGGEFIFGSTFSGTKNKFDDAGGGADVRTVNIKQRWKTGLSALLGTPISDTVSIYAKLGVLYSSFKLQVHNEPAAAATTSTIFTQNKKLWGVEPGVRLKYDINHSLSAHLDATYAWYQKAKEVQILPGAANADRAYAYYKPNIWGVTAGVSYKF